ncbi:conserved exported hypothetical protein [Crenothrix polyspora]|uniref:DUF1499 domain-containing protein n=2 Tax=Crenothrix polyspora TaxID=360316 RepID=A0A1R4HJ14_9GAMM|nr:conserved exported hypothetical protein [Crenothrix polyspora]
MKFKSILFMVLVMSSQANVAAASRLAPCLNSPNCVSSQANQLDERHYIAPFKIKGTPEAAWLMLRTTLKKHDRTIITHETATTLHAEAVSLVFSFVDDIDIILDANAGLIHIRSASRVGHSDFGVNRKRIEALRSQLQKANVIE